MTIISILATITGIASGLAIFRQVQIIYERRSARDLSISFNAFLFLTSIIWLFYGIQVSDFPLIITQALYTAGTGCVSVGCIVYSSALTSRFMKNAKPQERILEKMTSP